MSYAVPANTIAVLRCVDAYNDDTFDATMFIQGALGQAIAFLENTVTGSVNFSWRGRQVFYPGELITAHASAGTWDVTASGYLLSST